MLLLKYKIVPMTDYGFPRPLWNNETLGYLLTRPERFPFLPHIRMLYFPEKQIPLPARVAIPRDGFCLLQFELHQFHLIPPPRRGSFGQVPQRPQHRTLCRTFPTSQPRFNTSTSSLPV